MRDREVQLSLSTEVILNRSLIRACRVRNGACRHGFEAPSAKQFQRCENQALARAPSALPALIDVEHRGGLREECIHSIEYLSLFDTHPPGAAREDIPHH
jgi:hypothetical protein